MATHQQIDKTRSSAAARANKSKPQTGAHPAQILQRLEDAPGSIRPADVLVLQRTIGNRATERLLQAKLKLGPAGDQYEQEADRVAKEVVSASRQPEVQRAGVDEDELQAKPLAAGISQVQRMNRYADVSYTRPEPHQAKQAFVASLPTPKVQREGKKHEEMLQAAANHGLEGGDVDTDVARSIQSAKGSGQPLHDGVRRSMERGFGADFRGVRIHTGGDADTLNRSLNARAFTTGSDIFFGKGQYNPGSTGGQELIAHELTHTVQQGAAGVQRNTDVVQRAVGFEFEVGNWTVEKLHTPLTEEQKAGVEEVPEDAIDEGGLSKKSVLYAGKGYDMMVDESNDFHIEFVTEAPGFPESKDGRKRLITAMDDMVELGDSLIEQSPKATVKVEGQGFPRYLSDDLTPGSIMPQVLITPLKTMTGEPQTTAGIRLDQLAHVMERLSPTAMEGENKKKANSRSAGVQVLSGKKLRDATLLGQSPKAAREGFQTWVSNKPWLGFSAPSNELIGLLSILRSYLVSASQQIAYAKSLAPLMARTDMSTLFAQLPPREHTPLASNPAMWADLALCAAGMRGSDNTPFFSGTTQYVSKENYTKLADAMTRGEWLRSLTLGAGSDLLTEKNFPDRDVAELLFGLGGLDNKMDTVGKEHTFRKDTNIDNAPVFEFRRMQGQRPHTVWPALALSIYDYIREINDKKKVTYKAPRL